MTTQTATWRAHILAAVRQHLFRLPVPHQRHRWPLGRPGYPIHAEEALLQGGDVTADILTLIRLCYTNR